MTAAEGIARPSDIGGQAGPIDVSCLSGARFWLAFAALLSVASLPVLWTDVPPLLDYPNHFSRMYLLAMNGEVEPLRRYYEVGWHVIPNLAMDLVVPTLARIMPLPWAMKTFIVAAFAAIAAGTALVHRAASGRWSIWPLGAFLFLYNRIFLLGFLNYLFGIGVALVAFATWIALSRRPLFARLSVSAGFALALYFAHLMACAVYALLVTSYELGLAFERKIGARESLKRLILAALPFLVPMTLELAFRRDQIGQSIAYGSIVERLGYLTSAFDNYNDLFDLCCLALLMLPVAFLLVSRRLAVMRPVAAPAIALAVAFLLAPSVGLAGWGIAERLPILFYLLVAAGTIARPTLKTWMVRAIAIGGIALFAVRMGVVAREWDQADRFYAARLAQLDQVPEGGRLAVAFPSDLIASTNDFFTIVELPLLEIPRRNAFVPILAATPGQQPVALSREALGLVSSVPPTDLWSALTGGGTGMTEEMAAGLRRFDAVVLLDYRPFVVSAPAFLAPISVEPTFALYRVLH